MIDSYRQSFARWKWRRKNRHAAVARGTVILGNTSNITLGVGAVVESGAVLSTRHGGRIEIGDKTRISRGAMLLSYGGTIRIGTESSVNPYCVLYGHGGLIIGDYVRIAAHSVLIPANHTYSDASRPIHMQPLTRKGVTLGSDVWIGAGVCILDGVTIGDGCVVGAGSVVTRDLEPYTVSVGNPCATVKRRT